MVVLIEGVDRTGKSTLCKKLHDEQDFCIVRGQDLDIVKNQNKNPLFDLDCMYKMISIASMSDKNFVFDRAHISSAVYSITRRGYSQSYIDSIFAEVDNLIFEADNPLMVFLMPDSIEDVSSRAGEFLGNEEEEFERYIKKTRCNKIVTSYGNFDEVVKNIMIG